jgi:hypothetical protein
VSARPELAADLYTDAAILRGYRSFPASFV